MTLAENLIAFCTIDALAAKIEAHCTLEELFVHVGCGAFESEAKGRNERFRN